MITVLAVVLMAVAWATAADTDQPAPEGSPACQQPHEPRQYDGRTVDEWREVIKSLELTSPAAEMAVPGLIALCQDSAVPEQTRAQAAFLLGRIGEKATAAVPVLGELLTADEGPDSVATTRWAAKALALFGPLAADATPQLAAVAHDNAQPVLTRRAAIEALGRIGGHHRDAIPTLLQLAEPPDGRDEPSERCEIREAAVDSLSLVGPAAAAAVPLLIRLTRESHWPNRYRSALALSSIGPAAGVAADTLVDLVLFDDVKEVRNAAASALARIGEPGEASLRQLLSDEDVGVRLSAASALGTIEKLSDTSRQALLAALEDSDVNVRLNAVESLRKAAHDSESLLPILLSALTEPDRLPRMQAYRLVIEMRDVAEEIVPELERLADDERPYVQQAARKAIAELRQPETGN